MSSARSNKTSSDGDRVIEGRHLVGVFFAVVTLCGLFFTLGYVMGRSEHESIVSLAATAGKQSTPRPQPKAEQEVKPPGPAPTDWDFYPEQSAKASKPAAPAANPDGAAPSGQPPASKVFEVPLASSSATSSHPATPAQFAAPLIPRGAFLLQVAALAHESDALALADVLQQKKFPAFVLTPTADNLYRVQVGPYADSKSTEVAKLGLEREGFKTILKR